MPFTIHTVSIVDTLTFSETVRHNQHVVTVSDHLMLAQSDSSYEPIERLLQNLLYSQSLTFRFSGSKLLTQVLDFRQSASKGPVGDVYQNFTITQSVSPGNKWPLVNQTLNFVQTPVAVGTSGSIQTLSLNQTVLALKYKVIHFTQTLSLVQSTVYQASKVTYIAPQIPGEHNGPTAVLITPNVTPNTRVTFSYSGVTIYLKAPNFNNRDSIQFTRIQRDTRGGELIIYRDPLWNKGETFVLDFSFMSDIEARATQDFLRGTTGQLVTYTDYAGNSWTGVIQTPQLDIKKSGRFNNTFTITFEVTG